MTAEVVVFEDASVAFERDREVFRMRLHGATVRDIAQRLNMSSSAVQASVIRMTGGVAPDLRSRTAQLELDRLDEMMRGFFADALPELDGAGNITKRGNHESAKVVLGIMDRRARLLGLDATVSRGDSPFDPVTVRETTTERMEAVLRRLTGRDTIIEGEVIENAEAVPAVADKDDFDGG